MPTDLLDLREIPETLLPPTENLPAGRGSFFEEHKIWLIGIGILAVSQLLFLLPAISPYISGAGGRGGFFEQFFVISFVFVIAYAIVLWANKRLRWWVFGSRRPEYGTTLVYLMLWLTSCYSLNTEISIFNRSAGWLSVFLGVGGLACAAFELRDRMPGRARTILYGVLAAFGVLTGYLSLFLLPLVPLSAAVFWFFGLSFHTFVPLVLTVYLILILRNEWREREKSRPAILAGIALPVLVAVVFSVFWANRVSFINKITREQSFTQKSGLPGWVGIAQKLPADGLSERVLKAGEYYQTFDHGSRDWFFLNTSRDITRLQDPLVYIASIFSKTPSIDWRDEAQILRAVFGNRHDFQENFWSGFDLKTSEIAEKIHLDPAHRLAYTEKTLTILNESPHSWRQQEALYTFELPSGAAVTSLSLWVEGIERPAFLTAKSKADSAYRAIVGQERRDPAIVTWQEGSTVTLRVFPVTPANARRVKIGITSPLRLDGEELFYDETRFEGPPATGAGESIELTTFGQKLAEIPSFFHKKGEKTLGFDGQFRPDWSLKMPAEPLDATPFSFDGKTYRASTASTAPMERFKPSAIYLDLNGAFPKVDFEKISALARSKNIPLRAWLGGERLVELDSETAAREAFNFLKNDRFSIFPIQKIPDPATAILVTASYGPTPNISDLKGSALATDFEKMAAPGRPVRAFHLGKNCRSSFLNSLSDFRVVELQTGGVGELLGFLENEKFPQIIESHSVVKIPANNMTIEETTGELYETGKGSDQLMRLFAQQQILRQIGPAYFSKKYEPGPLVAMAEQAYVVSPVSSLVVLETDADYGRFDIKKPESSLSNATMPSGGILKKKEVPLPGEGLLDAAGNSSGSVPEPHEWALILMFSGVVLWMFWRRL